MSQNSNRFRIRKLLNNDEISGCVQLQSEVWGPRYAGEFTPIMLWIAQQLGGVIAGAFGPGNRLGGIVLGLTGFRHGELVHWSHLLAVRPELRNNDLGFRLKVFQRKCLLRIGVNVVLGTFDPLNSAMGHLLLSKLGATAGTYIKDAYPTSKSPLHDGIGTDRLLSEWRIDSRRVKNLIETKRKLAPVAYHNTPQVNSVLQRGRRLQSTSPDLAIDEKFLRLSVPEDIHFVRSLDRQNAVDWREKTRVAFQTYFRRGFRAVALIRSTHCCSYLLQRGS